MLRHDDLCGSEDAVGRPDLHQQSCIQSILSSSFDFDVCFDLFLNYYNLLVKIIIL